MAEKILIVDDDATMANLLFTVLEFEGFQPLKALSGEEAIRLVMEEAPDLVLLDIMMPEMDGFEVLASLRNDPRTERIPVIMLTARTEDRDMFEGWRRGADEYVTKPFDPHRLVEVIREVLARSYQERLEERARRVESLLELLGRMEQGRSEV
ncbi:response regulator [Candidatus Solincola tengchongensis]|uniref:response regulator transcription factor n=1 Tax=Candidatus Solincola tengchongensis TaxID=2900693 RepID=UPI00257BAF5D|nr:response regulator [Candidatus Solincola tengchongensis]